MRISTIFMKFVMFAALLASQTAMARPAPDTLRVMSFNVRYGTADDGPDSWTNRRDILVATIRAEHPDVIGTQELLKDQADYIVAQLPDYVYFDHHVHVANGVACVECHGRVDKMPLTWRA